MKLKFMPYAPHAIEAAISDANMWLEAGTPHCIVWRGKACVLEAPARVLSASIAHLTIRTRQGMMVTYRMRKPCQSPTAS